MNINELTQNLSDGFSKLAIQIHQLHSGDQLPGTPTALTSLRMCGGQPDTSSVMAIAMDQNMMESKMDKIERKMNLVAPTLERRMQRWMIGCCITCSLIGGMIGGIICGLMMPAMTMTTTPVPMRMSAAGSAFSAPSGPNHRDNSPLVAPVELTAVLSWDGGTAVNQRYLIGKAGETQGPLRTRAGIG